MPNEQTKDKPTFIWEIAPPVELSPDDKQLWSVEGSQWRIDFGVLDDLMWKNYNYLRSQFGENELNWQQVSTSPEIVQQGKKQLEQARQVIGDNPQLVIMDENTRYWQVQIAIFDALQGLLGIMKSLQNTKSILVLRKEDIQKILPMMQLQYQLRTNRSLLTSSSEEILPEETETARQIRLVYNKLITVIAN